MSLSLSLSVSSDPFGSPKLFFFGKRVIFFPQLWCPSLDRNLFGVLAFPTRSESFCGHLQMIPRRILVFVFFRPPIHNPAPPPEDPPTVSLRAFRAIDFFFSSCVLDGRHRFDSVFSRRGLGPPAAPNSKKQQTKQRTRDIPPPRTDRRRHCWTCPITFNAHATRDDYVYIYIHQLTYIYIY